jgi:hypothetical protein
MVVWLLQLFDEDDEENPESGQSSATASPVPATSRGIRHALANASPVQSTSRGIRLALATASPVPSTSRGIRHALATTSPVPSTSRGIRHALATASPVPSTSRGIRHALDTAPPAKKPRMGSVFTQAERQHIWSKFAGHISALKCPSRAECEAYINEYSTATPAVTWRRVKDAVMSRCQTVRRQRN